MKMTDIKPGDRIKGFEDFGCIPANATRIVRQDDAGRLFVACRQGHHLLDGQEDDAGELVGLSRAPSPLIQLARGMPAAAAR